MFISNIWLMIILFLFGGLLIVVELVVPGFGVPGLAGVTSLIAGVVVGSSVLTTVQLALVILLVFVFVLVMVILLYRSAFKNGRMSRLLFLRSKAGKEEGYSSSESFDNMLGMEGMSIGALRPSGIGEFNGRKMDVLTDGEFIPKGVKIKIIRVEGF
ncbi:MAG TPA: NfeD family protein, partial [Clostridia bacterium]|nr:NfeD family protein [Clostridia bacterium]